MSDEELQNNVKKLLLSNISEGYSRLLKANYCYVQPSPHTYPFQFWWDTCFHIFMLVRLKEFDIAKKNLRSLFAMQEKDGFSGHMIFWKQLLPHRWSDILQTKPTLQLLRPHMSALIQPPLAAQALLKIIDETNDFDFLRELLPKIKKYHKWLYKNRNFNNDNLISIISPFESGIDWKPTYDKVLGFNDGQANSRLFYKAVFVDGKNFLRGYNLKSIFKAGYFVVKDTLVNTLYVLDLLALSELCKRNKDPDAKVLKMRADMVTSAILNLMYDEKNFAFYDINSKNQEKLKVNTATIFSPIALPNIPKDIGRKIIEKHLLNKDEFNTDFPIPSTAINEPAFSPYETPYLWRGPTWVVFNWLLYKCFLRQNFRDQAEKIYLTVKRLIEKSGFREYYNPFNGAGYGAKNFTWSGLIIDMKQ